MELGTSGLNLSSLGSRRRKYHKLRAERVDRDNKNLFRSIKGKNDNRNTALSTVGGAGLGYGAGHLLGERSARRKGLEKGTLEYDKHMKRRRIIGALAGGGLGYGAGKLSHNILDKRRANQWANMSKKQKKKFLKSIK